MRSPFAYIPRRGPLQSARPGAAVAYLGALVVVAFLYSNPVVLVAAGLAACLAGRLAGARTAVRAALRMGLGLAVLIVVVNALVVDRGETVLARLGDVPILGQVDITLEAIVAGLSIGLRAAVTMVAFCVYSACVDPDRVLRALRPVAARSALTASLVSRLVPVAAADAGRLRDAAQLRGPGAAAVGRGPLARRLLAGSLDRAVDVAATLELRGYSLPGPRGARRPEPCRHDVRFYAVAAAVLVVAILGKVLGADDFHTYPTIQIGLGPATLAVCAVVLASGLAPWRRGRKAARRQAAQRRATRRGPRARRERRAGVSELAIRRGAAPALAVESLTYSYPRAARPALVDVSLAVAPGEFVLLAGRSASGKSTLLRAACGLVPHFHGGEVDGRVEVAGLDAIAAGPGELAAAVGYLAQDPETQVVSTTVAAEIELPLEMRGDAPGDRARAVEEVALALAIPHLLGRAVDTLSGGELQRVALAAALVTRPRLVLLDEPTSQLDPVSGDELIWLLRRLNEEWGVAVLLAEHRLERCLAAADRVVAVEAGRIGFDGAPREFLAWARDADPTLSTPAARLFSLAGIEPLPVGVRDARRTLEDGGAATAVPTRGGFGRRQVRPDGRAHLRRRRQSRRGSYAFEAKGLWVELDDGEGAARRAPRHRPRRSPPASGSR